VRAGFQKRPVKLLKSGMEIRHVSVGVKKKKGPNMSHPLTLGLFKGGKHYNSKNEGRSVQGRIHFQRKKGGRIGLLAKGS